jgi:hypothetical protein
LAGQAYRVRVDMAVTALTLWAGPFSGGYDRTLRAGEVIVVPSPPRPGATSVNCVPQDYERLQRELIPLRDRLQFWVYRGYHLSVDARDLADKGERIDRPDGGGTGGQ